MLAAVVVLISFIAITTVESLSTSNVITQPKRGILSLIDGPKIGSDIYVCPESLSPLKKIHRYFGFVEKQYLQSSDSGATKYDVLPGEYVDLTIKSEVERSFFSLTNRERVGEKFFQSRLIPALYERGYRQNFEQMGFPGVDKEFEEINDFFQAANVESVLDLSCGSGFMTRKFVGSHTCMYRSIYTFIEVYLYL
jgi:hypothetical protein